MEQPIRVRLPPAEGFFDEIHKLNNNRYCFECGEPPTGWGSVSLGIFLCTKCAGLHRSFGVDVSFVRSLTLDHWKDHQLMSMKLGGNDRAKLEFAEKVKELHGMHKYTSSAAVSYKEKLKKEVMETLGLPYEPPPTGLKYTPSSIMLINTTVMQKYRSVSSISSDEYFGRPVQKKKCSCPCCII